MTFSANAEFNDQRSICLLLAIKGLSTRAMRSLHFSSAVRPMVPVYVRYSYGYTRFDSTPFDCLQFGAIPMIVPRNIPISNPGIGSFLFWSHHPQSIGDFSGTHSRFDRSQG
jgi:hypothetical protein